MKLTCFILSLLLVSMVSGQQIKGFYDFQWKPTDIAHARFYSVIEHTDSGWHRLDYFIHDLSLQMEGWYEDSACKTASGKFVYAYPNKMVENTGRYLHGKKQGLWLSFYPNGIMADSTVYDNGHPVGISLSWHINGYPSDSSFYNADGSGVQVGWFDNGNLSFAGRLAPDSKRHGKWKFLHKNGQTSAIQIYDQGKLLDKQYFDEAGQLMADTTNKDRKASFKGGDAEWLKYLGRHLDFPPNYQITNSDVAAVEVTLSVDEDGNIKDTFISIPFYPAFDKIALNVIGHSPKWVPAMDHNRRVRADFRQAVIFSQPEDSR